MIPQTGLWRDHRHSKYKINGVSKNKKSQIEILVFNSFGYSLWLL